MLCSTMEHGMDSPGGFLYGKVQMLFVYLCEVSIFGIVRCSLFASNLKPMLVCFCR